MNSKDSRQDKKAVSYGVEELINRLRDEGVTAGRTEAERIVADAEVRAKWLVSQAQDEADSLVETARRDAKALQSSANDALRVAARDMLLSLRERLTHRFAGEVRRLVSEQMSEKEFLKQLILEIAGQQSEALKTDGPVEVLLPQRALELDELREDPGELHEGALTNLVLEITGNMLRQGVKLALADDDQVGVRARIVDEEVEVDVTTEAVSTLLLEHLQPRFRALLEGIVRG